MRRSGVIFAAVMAVAAGILGFIFPWFVPCVALIVGAIAGFLGASFEQALTSGDATRRGAGAGAIAGIGAWAGHILGGVASAAIGPNSAAALIERFGPSTDVSSPWAYYTAALGFGCCFGLVEIALMAGLGAVGGLIWFQARGPASRAGRPASPA